MRCRPLCVVIVTAAVALAGPADAGFSSPASAALAVSSATLAPPAVLSGVCLLLPARMTLTWTASATVGATGYTVLRRTTGGTFTTVGTVSGRTTTGFVDLTVSVLQAYDYVVLTTVHAWTSTPTSVTVTCLG